MIAGAKKVAKQADVVALCIGGNELTSREAWSLTHMGDRTNLDLVGRQEAVIALQEELGPLAYRARRQGLASGGEKSVGDHCEQDEQHTDDRSRQSPAVLRNHFDVVSLFCVAEDSGPGATPSSASGSLGAFAASLAAATELSARPGWLAWRVRLGWPARAPQAR